MVNEEDGLWVGVGRDRGRTGRVWVGVGVGVGEGVGGVIRLVGALGALGALAVGAAMFIFLVVEEFPVFFMCCRRSALADGNGLVGLVDVGGLVPVVVV